MNRNLSANERIHAAHAIREIDDHMLGFARALDVRHGMAFITDIQFDEGVDKLIERLRSLKKCKVNAAEGTDPLTEAVRANARILRERREAGNG